jgi:hypothetical protein
MSSITSIAKACGTNVGGLRYLQVVDVEDILSIPDAIDGIIQSAISLKSGVDLAVIGFPQGTGEFTESTKDADSGQVKTSKIRVELPKDAVELGEWANTFDEREVVAIYMDENGVAVIVGDLDRPLSIKINRNIGRRPSDKNYYEMSLEGISDHYAYYYMMFEKKAPGNRRVYTAGYTFGFQRS